MYITCTKRFLGKSSSVTRLSVISNAADVMYLMDLTKANSTNNQDGKYVYYVINGPSLIAQFITYWIRVGS